MAIRHETAKKAAFNLGEKRSKGSQRLEYGIDNETTVHQTIGTYVTSLVDITPSETATLTMMRGNVIIEQRALGGM
jgi:hypothetical protein